MTLIAQIVLLLWVPISIFFFRNYSTRTAILLTLIGGILFLPQKTVFVLPLIPDYDTRNAVVYGLLVGLLLYKPKWIWEFQPWWLDLPMLIWCISPLFTSLSNELGLYDGINESFGAIWSAGIPYLLGRIYFSKLAELKTLAIAIVKGGLIYVPLCIWEGLMSPQLHRLVYGYFPHESGFRQVVRYGGYRPTVFMSHGLAVGLWMMVAALIAVWLWQSKTLREVWGFDIIYIVPVLVFTSIWCRSTAAVLYLFFGLSVLVVAKWGKSNWPLLLLIVGIIGYLCITILGYFNKQAVLESLSNFLPSARLQSLEFRWDNEEILIVKARERFWQGWGGWSRSRVFEENFEGIFEDVSITDSLWVISFGTKGLIGVISLGASLLLPPVLFSFLGYPVKTWFHPKVGPASVFAVLLVLFMFDNLFNSFLNPLYFLITGGLTGLIVNPRESLSKVSSENLSVSVDLSKMPEKMTKK